MGAGLEVELLVCSVGFRLAGRKNALDGEGNETRCTERSGDTHLKVCTHTRVTRMLGLHPSHESKLFETEKEIRNGQLERGRKGDREWLGGIGGQGGRPWRGRRRGRRR